ncbi:MAG: Ig-like domain-containing protein [Clostridia bacterium]|nr:Ig-like domain-containing protein [Clostridia bacterium]
MKKILALLLAAALVASCTIVSYAADDMPELIFDMDLSGCSASTIAVTDSSGSGKTGTITYGNAGTEAKPGYGINEYGTPYLVLDEAGNTTAKNGTINVPLTDATILDSDGLSISTWIYDANSAKRDSKYIFGFGTGADTNMEWATNLRKTGSGTFVGVRIEGTSLKDGDTAINIGTNPYSVGTWIDTYKDSWKHLVITKQWTTTNASTGKGYYTIVTYLDGTRLASYTNSKDDTTQKIRQKYSDTRNTAVLEIGGDGGNTADKTFAGYIADFKLYNGVLTETQVKSEYIATGTGYLPTVTATHSLTSLGRSDSEFTVTFDGAVDKETLKTGVTITDAEEGEIHTAFKSYDEISKVATFSIFDYLEAGATYTLNLPGVRDTNGFALSQTKLTFTAKNESEATISAPSITYKNSEGTEVDAAVATTADIAATVTNTSEETLTYFLSLSIKDTAGGAYKMDVSAPLTLTAGASNELTLNATGLIPGGSVVTRIWCMTEGGKFYPLETPALLP